MSNNVEKILHKNGSGWCKITVGSFCGNASYLTDVPFDFLYAFKNYIDNKSVPVIDCDEEGSEFKIIIDEFKTYIIVERENTDLVTFDVKRKDFVSIILKDIEENLDWFAIDFSYTPENETEVLQRKIDLLSNIKYIKEHMEEF